MRLVIGQLLSLVQRYPPLVDGAFIIIAWVGLKLLIEYGHATEVLHFEIPKTISLGLIAVIFAASYIYARMKGPVALPGETDQRAARLVTDSKD